MENEIFEHADDSGGNVPIPGMDGYKMPSLEELLKAIEKMEMPEEQKEELRESLISNARAAIHDVNPEGLSQQADAAGLAPDIVILLIFITIIALVFVFFGYKLYQSLVARERRKEEKRRQKQQKKKK